MIVQVLEMVFALGASGFLIWDLIHQLKDEKVLSEGQNENC